MHGLAAIWQMTSPLGNFDRIGAQQQQQSNKNQQENDQASMHLLFCAIPHNTLCFSPTLCTRNPYDNKEIQVERTTPTDIVV